MDSTLFGLDHLILVLLGLLIFLSILIKISNYFVRKEAKNKFQQQVFDEFRKDPQAAGGKYFPTEQEILFYQQLYQNQQAQAQTASAMANVAYASGGDNFLASVGQIGSSFNASNARKRLQLIYSILFYATRTWEGLHSSNQDIDEIIINTIEFTYYKQLAIESGVIPYGTTPLKTIHNVSGNHNLLSRN